MFTTKGKAGTLPHPLLPVVGRPYGPHLGILLSASAPLVLSHQRALFSESFSVPVCLGIISQANRSPGWLLMLVSGVGVPHPYLSATSFLALPLFISKG